MVPRKPPEPLDLSSWRRFDQSTRLQRKIAEYAVAHFLERPYILHGLSREEKVYVHHRATSPADLDPELLVEQMNRLKMAVVSPRRNEPTWDLLLALRQPELDSLWEEWWDDSIPQRYATGFEGHKAIMVTWAGLSSTMIEAIDRLAHEELLFDYFDNRSRRTSRGAAIQLRDPSNVSRQLTRMSWSLVEVAPRIAAKIAASLCRLYPEEEMCVFMSSDGQLQPAWVEQKTGKRNGEFDPEYELFLRRRSKEASARAYTYRGEGREDIDEPKSQLDKLVRGYNHQPLVDIKSGHAVAHIHGGAGDIHEPDEYRNLLQSTYDVWPEFPARYLVTDKLGDENEEYEHLERAFGVHLVASRHGRNLVGTNAVADLSLPSPGGDILVHRSVSGFDGRGRLYCRNHPGEPLRFAYFDAPNRTKLGLAPGELSPAAAFRYRAICEKGCGVINVATREAWRFLTALPFHGYGTLQRQRDYALRFALQAMRNIGEAQHSSMLVGFKVAGKDGTRLRVDQRIEAEALVWLAELIYGGCLLANARLLNGDIPLEEARLPRHLRRNAA